MAFRFEGIDVMSGVFYRPKYFRVILVFGWRRAVLIVRRLHLSGVATDYEQVKLLYKNNCD